MGVARFTKISRGGVVSMVRFWSKIKVKIWLRSRVKAENGGSKLLTPVAGGSTESMQPTSPYICPAVLRAIIADTANMVTFDPAMHVQ